MLSRLVSAQILGAEKALFRALKTKSNTPKYGLIYHSSFIGRAQAKNKGRISRYLANKCSIASRIDCFAEATTTAFGEKLKEQVRPRCVALRRSPADVLLSECVCVSLFAHVAGGRAPFVLRHGRRAA